MLTISKYLLLAFICLFLLFILLAIWQDLKDKKERVTQGRLTALDGYLSGQSFTFSDSISIGRGPLNNLILDDGYASISHAIISKQDGDFFIQDLDSTNGTYLNGARISKPVTLNDSDTISVGKNVFRFEQEGK